MTWVSRYSSCSLLFNSNVSLTEENLSKDDHLAKLYPGRILQFFLNLYFKLTHKYIFREGLQ